MVDISGGALLEIAKQAPGLGVLVYLTIQFLKAQKERDVQFSQTIEAMQTRSQSFGHEAMERSERTSEAMQRCVEESTQKITACVTENAKALGKATQVIERHEKFYEANCARVQQLKPQEG